MASVRERVEALQRYRSADVPGWIDESPNGQLLHRDDVLALADQLDREEAEHSEDREGDREFLDRTGKPLVGWRL